MDVYGRLHDDHTRVTHYTCHGGANQHFRPKYAGTAG
jgi:hypothetical protein